VYLGAPYAFFNKVFLPIKKKSLVDYNCINLFFHLFLEKLLLIKLVSFFYA
jgi:hypothetical protein